MSPRDKAKQLALIACVGLLLAYCIISYFQPFTLIF